MTITSPHNRQAQRDPQARRAARARADGALRGRGRGSRRRRRRGRLAAALRARRAAGSGRDGDGGRARAARGGLRARLGVARRSASTSSAGPSPPARCCVALWGVRDPGNVGTVMRAAHAFGAAASRSGRAAPTRTARRPCARRWARSSRVPLARGAAIAELPGARSRSSRATGEALRGPLDGRGRSSSAPSATGCPRTVVAGATRSAHIPIAGDSLNAAMAATVALYEALGWPADERRSTGSPSCAREAEAAIAAAATTAALEELRVALPRPQGRAAPPAARRRRAAARGARRRRQGRQRGAPGARGADRASAGAARRAPSSSARLARDRVDVTLPGAPPQPVGRLHLLTQTRREIEDVFLGLGFQRRRGARGRDRPLQLRRAQPQPDAPGAGARRHLLRRPTTRCCARTPRRCRSARWRRRRRRST